MKCVSFQFVELFLSGTTECLKNGARRLAYEDGLLPWSKKTVTCCVKLGKFDFWAANAGQRPISDEIRMELFFYLFFCFI